MTERERLSVVVTTFDSAGTLDACLRSVTWADEIVVLDSGSTDATLAIAAHYGARIHAQPFAGYSAQKQAAIDLASHRWVLLLDSDESLAAEAVAVLEQALVQPRYAGFQLWRREWQFWRWQSLRSRLNHYVRLFDRERARMSGAGRWRDRCAGGDHRSLRRARHRRQGVQGKPLFQPAAG
jgi:glycosyltransferase involved in cell wall biosynthesis